MKPYRCPTCGKTLTEREYEKALRIQQGRKQHLHRKEAELERRQKEWREKERDRQKAADEKLKKAKETIQRRANLQQDALKGQLQKLKERLRQREKGTTPQTEGLAFEGTLTARLKREFPDDTIEHKGKGGDVLHTVRLSRKAVGIILYECKRTPSVLNSHVAQARRDKQQREAEFAVLVTTGKKKGFNGFAQMNGVWVVSPFAVLTLASLLRQHLVEMAHLKIGKDKRAILAQQLMHYIDSPQFRNPIEDSAHRASMLEEMIRKEAVDHYRTWQERFDHYVNIKFNATHVQDNVH